VQRLTPMACKESLSLPEPAAHAEVNYSCERGVSPSFAHAASYNTTTSRRISGRSEIGFDHGTESSCVTPPLVYDHTPAAPSSPVITAVSALTSPNARTTSRLSSG